MAALFCCGGHASVSLDNLIHSISLFETVVIDICICYSVLPHIQPHTRSRDVCEAKGLVHKCNIAKILGKGIGIPSQLHN
jgi:hypothetical protein